MSMAATEPRTTSAISVECVKSNDAEVIDARAARHLSGWDSQHACVYGAASAKAFGLGSRTWEDVAPLVRAGWAGRHEKACDPRHDWRLCWPAVKDGWVPVGDTRDSLRPGQCRPLSLGVVRRFAPRLEQVQSLLGFATFTRLTRVHLQAKCAAVDLRRTRLHQMEE